MKKERQTDVVVQFFSKKEVWRDPTKSHNSEKTDHENDVPTHSKVFILVVRMMVSLAIALGKKSTLLATTGSMWR